MQSHVDPILAVSVSVSPCEPCLVDFVGHVLLVSSIHSDSYSFSFCSEERDSMETSNLDFFSA